MQPDIDLNSVHKILKQCSDSYQNCGCGKCNNFELKNALAYVRKVLCASTILMMQTSLEGHSDTDIIHSELDAIQMVLNEAIKLNNSVKIEPVQQVLIQYSFLKQTEATSRLRNPRSRVSYPTCDLSPGIHVRLPSLYWSLSRCVLPTDFNNWITKYSCHIPDDIKWFTPAHLLTFMNVSDTDILIKWFGLFPKWFTVRDDFMNLPFHYASRFSSIKVIEFYLHYMTPASIKMVGFMGQSILHLACSYQNTDIMRVLWDFDELMLHVYDAEHCTPFHRACIRGDLNVIQFILTLDPNVALLKKDMYSALPLHVCSHISLDAFVLVLKANPMAFMTTTYFDGTHDNLFELLAAEKLSAADRKIEYICDHYPQFMSDRSDYYEQLDNSGHNPQFMSEYVDQRDNLVDLPFRFAIRTRAHMRIIQAVYNAYPEAINIRGTDGLLPIHLHTDSSRDQALCDVEIMKFLIKHSPDSLMKPYNSSGIHITPYEEVLNRKCYVYQRMMLYADPNRHRDRYEYLNWEARRWCMFLGFKAKTADGFPCIFERMQIKNFDCFRVIVTFL